MELQAQARQAAAQHERSFTLEERRRTGTVYTPPRLVELILDLAGYTPDVAIESATLLDPACGCGVFLEHAARRLFERCRHLRSRSSSPRRFLEAIESNLSGLDKDERAASLAVELIRHTAGELVGAANVAESFFEGNVVRSDFLNAPDAQLELFRAASEERFDFIVGNPPYVTTTRLTDEEKDQLRGRFISAHGRIDLYCLFFERALELLRDGGVLAFITPDKFLTSESTTPLRKLIASRGSVLTVARFRSHRVFEGAATVPCVTVIRKSQTKSSTVYMECKDSDRRPDGRIEVIARRKAAAPPSSGDAWHFLEPSLGRIASSLRESHSTLQQVSRRISAGIATGRDGIFVVPPDRQGELEEDLLHPCVRGQDLNAFEIADTGARVIIPYTHDSNGEPRLANLERYPRLNAYLEAHRGQLEARHCVRTWNKEWFDIHDPWTFNVTSQPKILFPDVSNSNRFAFDEGRYCPLHSAYYVIPQGVDPEYLTALLSSNVVEFFIRLFAPVVKDGFSRYRKQFVKEIPVPEIARREQSAIVRAAEQDDVASLNERVARVFGLSSRDASLVDEFVMDARARASQSSAATSDSKAA